MPKRLVVVGAAAEAAAELIGALDGPFKLRIVLLIEREMPVLG